MKVAAGTRDTIRFAERMLALLERGSFVATYKYAVLLGLMDLCLESSDRHGLPRESVTTNQLAHKVLELYWMQTVPYLGGPVLKQNTDRQARILSDILLFRETLPVPLCSLVEARAQDAAGFQRLVHRIEWTLILMPLPRVQTFGGRREELIYRIGWDESIEKRKRDVTRYQRDEPGAFDNRIHFLPGVAENLRALSGLLRPLIHREWARMVAQINGREESRLEEFLFAPQRAQTLKLRSPLVEIQSGRCFYCDDRLRGAVEVDHFIPWARYPDNGVHNLVAAHAVCNGNKSDFLASARHVRRWVERLRPGSGSRVYLEKLATDTAWEHGAERTLGVARGIYLRLPADTMLWQGVREFVKSEPVALERALAV